MCRGYFSSQEIDTHHATEHRSTDQSRNGCRMCCFCHAQPFEITRAKNIKSTFWQHSCQNAKVVEAFCHVACRLSNQRRPSIHQPTIDEFRMPAEMSIALSRAHLHARMHVASCWPPRPPSRSPPTYDPHSTRCTAGCPYFPRLRALALFGRRPAQSAERLVVAGVQKTRTRPVIQEWRTHGRIFSFKVGRYPPFVSGSFGSLGKEGGDEIPRAHYDQHCRENEATCDQGGFAFCETVQGQSSSPEIRSWQAARYPHMSGHRFNW